MIMRYHKSWEIYGKPRIIVQKHNVNDVILDYKTNDLTRVMKIANQKTPQA